MMIQEKVGGRLSVRRYWLDGLGDRVMIVPDDDAARAWLAQEYGHREGVACNPFNAEALLEQAKEEGLIVTEVER